MKGFLADDFLLQTAAAEKLYHEYADKMPIFDYHCHLPPSQIAGDIQFENLTQAWLYGDHYKWRAMRTNGIDERYCTGDTTDWEKFYKWAETVPNTLRNPLYHWTHLELKRHFKIDKLLNPDTAKEIYLSCNEQLASPGFSTRNIMRRMNVKAVCTTDDPTDSLEHHIKIAEDGFEIKVLPTWRPDRGMAAENIDALNIWIDKLEEAADVDIKDFNSYLNAIKKRHDFFHEVGCRISDHGLETIYVENYTDNEIKSIFDKIRKAEEPSIADHLRFKSAMIFELALMDAEKGWVQQLHLGALRNNNTMMMRQLGADTGFDSIGDIEIAKPLAKFLDKLNTCNKLPKTIIYNLNPKDNYMLAAMVGSFQDGSVPGKMQFGSGWWFLDNIDGMNKQIEALSNLGLLSRFVGMLTDSRSFLSYPRHEYFRRILCNIIGRDIENGLLPDDMALIGKMVQGICFENAVSYFDIEVK